MRVRHPIDARTFGDLGVPFLVDYALASTLGEKGVPGRSHDLAERIARRDDARSLREDLRVAIGLARSSLPLDASDLRALAEADALIETETSDDEVRRNIVRWTAIVEGVLARALDATPVDVGRPFFASMPLAAGALIDALALARTWLSRGAGEILLPAAPEPRAALPPRMQGDVVLIEVGDLRDAASAALHDMMFASLRGRSVCWRWIHGPTTRHPDAVQVSRLAEAVANHASDSFWDAIEALFRSSVTPPGVWRTCCAISRSTQIA